MGPDTEACVGSDPTGWGVGVVISGVVVGAVCVGVRAVCVGVEVDWAVGAPADDGLLNVWACKQPATPARTVMSTNTKHTITTFLIIRLAFFRSFEFENLANCV